MSKIGEAKKKILHFYCYTCKAYEFKTSPHYRNQKRRFANRQKVKLENHGVLLGVGTTGPPGPLGPTESPGK